MTRKSEPAKTKRVAWALLGVLTLLGLGSQAKAVAQSVRGPAFTTSFTTLRDPVAFAEEMTVISPPPVIPLTRRDAVAHELYLKNRTMTEADTIRTAEKICEEADALGVDPLLFLALIRIESNYNHLAISPVGAEGLMQLMPSTAEWMAERVDLSWPDGNSFDPVLNVQLGGRYLARLYRQFGRWDTALTAYNRGPRATRYILAHNGNRLPNAVRDFYATKVIRKYVGLVGRYGQLPTS